MYASMATDDKLDVCKHQECKHQITHDCRIPWTNSCDQHDENKLPPLNQDDVDPISLEPVCSVWPYFEIPVQHTTTTTSLAPPHASDVVTGLPSQQQQQHDDDDDDKGNDDKGNDDNLPPDHHEYTNQPVLQRANQQNRPPALSVASVSVSVSVSVRRYDAWAWLEMLVRDVTGLYKHPVTGERIVVRDRASCLRACREAHVSHVSHVSNESGACDALESHDVLQTVSLAENQQAGDSTNLFAHHASLLASCQSRSVQRVDDRDVTTGRLRSVQFYCNDPSVDVVVMDAWSKWHSNSTKCPEWAAVVNSEVAVKYKLCDANGEVFGTTHTLWFG